MWGSWGWAGELIDSLRDELESARAGESAALEEVAGLQLDLDGALLEIARLKREMEES